MATNNAKSDEGNNESYAFKRNDNRELVASCKLGFLNLNQNRTSSLIHSAVATPQEDDSLDESRSPMFHASSRRNSSSQNLKRTKIGGFIPSVIEDPGAPMCTFAFGGIKPNAKHPIFNLIKGPNYYRSNFWVDEMIFSDDIAIIEPTNFSKVSEVNYVIQKLGNVAPIIPQRKINAFELVDTKELTTYNVWQIKSVGRNQKFNSNYRLYQGSIPTNSEDPQLTNIIKNNSSYCVLDAVGTTLICERMYPISKDLAYYSDAQQPELFFVYPHDNEIQKRTIYASEGMENSSFILEMNIEGVTTFDATFNSESINYPFLSDLIICFGSPSDDLLDRIYEKYHTKGQGRVVSDTEVIQDDNLNVILPMCYTLILSTDNKAALYMDDKLIGTFDTKLTPGPQEICLVVHFAGKNMFLGLGAKAQATNPQNWSVFNELFEQDTPNSKVPNAAFAFEHFLSADAVIQIIPTNLKVTFRYSSLCFNNVDYDGFDYDLVKVGDKKYQWERLQSDDPYGGFPFYKFAFIQKITKEDLDNLNLTNSEEFLDDSFQESKLNKDLLSNGMYNPSTAFNPKLLTNSVPPNPYFNASNNKLFEDLDHSGNFLYDHRITKCPFVYQHITSTSLYSDEENSTFGYNNEINISGRVFFLGTIEGPILMRVSSMDEAGAIENNHRPDTKIIESLTWGDVTDYFTECNIDVSFLPQSFNTIQKKSARISLSNLHTTEKGAAILYLIKNNILSITIQAGYILDKKPSKNKKKTKPKKTFSTYFEGIIKNVSILENKEGGELVIEAVDVLTYLLFDDKTAMYFPNTTQFRGLRYGDIIKACFDFAGLKHNDYLWVSLTEELLSALNVRTSFLISEGASNKDTLSTWTTPQTIIGTPIKKVMPLIVAQKIDNFNKKINDISLPCLFYDVYSEDEISNNNIFTLTSKDETTILPKNEDEEEIKLSNIDEFKFYGIANEYLPDINTEDFVDKLHLLIANSVFRVANDVDNLCSKVRVSGTRSDGTRFINKRVLKEAFDSELLKNAIDKDGKISTKLPRGYVGYEKEFVTDTKDDLNLDTLLITSDDKARKIVNFFVKHVSRTLESIEFSCILTKPLKDFGKFKLKVLQDEKEEEEQDAYVTDLFFYSKVSYQISKSKSYISATIQGTNMSYLSGMTFAESLPEIQPDYI